MDCPPGQKRSGRYGEVTVSGGSTVRITGFNSQCLDKTLLFVFNKFQYKVRVYSSSSYPRLMSNI